MWINPLACQYAHFQLFHISGAQTNVTSLLTTLQMGFPGDPGVKNPPASAGDMGSIPSLGGSHMP